MHAREDDHYFAARTQLHAGNRTKVHWNIKGPEHEQKVKVP